MPTERAESIAARARASEQFRKQFPLDVNSWRASINTTAIVGLAKLDLVNVESVLDFDMLAVAMEANANQILAAGIREGTLLAPAYSPAGLIADGSIVTLTEQFAATRSAELVRLIDTGAREGIRETIAAALRNDLTRAEAASLIGRQAGLTRRQVISVNNFADSLAKQFVVGDVVLTDAAIDRINLLVNDFERRILEHRGVVIATTEAQRSLQVGEYAYWSSALDSENTPFSRANASKQWKIVGGNVCPICIGIPLAPVGFDAFFVSSTGWMGLYPPAHPLCKCYVEYSVQQS